MSELQKINISSEMNSSLPNYKGEAHNSYNIEAHVSSNMKLERPKVSAADFSSTLQNNNKYSYSEANKQLMALNNDIYEGTKKEKEKHEFNLKRYFTIFGILGILTAAFAYFRRGK